MKQESGNCLLPEKQQISLPLSGLTITLISCPLLIPIILTKSEGIVTAKLLPVRITFCLPIVA